MTDDVRLHNSPLTERPRDTPESALALEMALRRGEWFPDLNVCKGCGHRGADHDLNNHCLICGDDFASLSETEKWRRSTSVALRSLADHGYGLIPSSVMDQANDEIRTRQAEIARLRAALKSMLDLWDDAAPDPDDVDRDVLIPARAALAEGDERSDAPSLHGYGLDYADSSDPHSAYAKRRAALAEGDER